MTPGMDPFNPLRSDPGSRAADKRSRQAEVRLPGQGMKLGKYVGKYLGKSIGLLFLDKYLSVNQSWHL